MLYHTHRHDPVFVQHWTSPTTVESECLKAGVACAWRKEPPSGPFLRRIRRLGFRRGCRRERPHAGLSVGVKSNARSTRWNFGESAAADQVCGERIRQMTRGIRVFTKREAETTCVGEGENGHALRMRIITHDCGNFTAEDGLQLRASGRREDVSREITHGETDAPTASRCWHISCRFGRRPSVVARVEGGIIIDNSPVNKSKG